MRCVEIVRAALLLGPALFAAAPAPVPDRGALAADAVAGARFRFGGALGERIDANVRNWLLTAPQANPGMLAMFRVRDRTPVPDLVPWAGEFVGKYLISAVQALAMTGDPALRECVEGVVRAFIATQAEDGYLGPFRKEERLLGRWDLWGHYHAILALLMWHEERGDAGALGAACRAADLACATFLDGKKRVIDAGSPEMNMASIHALGRLYRATGNERYLRLMREIERDWEKAGDYFRTGLAGTPFHRTPHPRWESLHDVQGLVELYRITGDARYKTAFLNLWESIRRCDRHPSGAFSTGEQAVGNPYGGGAIETCCTTAWMELTLDALRLTGGPRAADELELSTWNAVLGSQHPSGRWWTYHTPMEGVREASAHSIVFQARHGTPELNCCSVNGPRGLGILREWAVMRRGESAAESSAGAEGFCINFYGPCVITVPLDSGETLTLTQETRYPLEGDVAVRIGLARERAMSLGFRIPEWSLKTTVRVRRDKVGAAVIPVREPGGYVWIERAWRDGDTVELAFDVRIRSWAGALGRAGRAAIHRGPLLLGFDQHRNAIDVKDVPTLDLLAAEFAPGPRESGRTPLAFAPIAAFTVRAGDGADLVLCDFASCGAHGTPYTAWLPAVNATPAAFWLVRPAAGAAVAAGPIVLEWTGHRAEGTTYTLAIAEDREFTRIAHEIDAVTSTRHVLETGLDPAAGTWWWKVTAMCGKTPAANSDGPGRFVIDPALANTAAGEIERSKTGPRGLLAASPLDGNGTPSFGVLVSETDTAPAEDRFGREGGAVAFPGSGCGITYGLASFPERECTFLAWVCPNGLPADRLQQVFSAWCAGMDDPLRVVFQGGELFARIEAQQSYGTAGVPAENGKWVHVAAVKRGPRLELYVDGELRVHAEAPEHVFSQARDFAIGANPHYSGNECFAGAIDSFAFHGEALSPAEIAAACREGK